MGKKFSQKLGMETTKGGKNRLLGEKTGLGLTAGQESVNSGGGSSGSADQGI